MKASDIQLQASNPSHSVWVAANAGTGKTKVLTDRVLRLLLSGTEPTKILCLTFTNAAAAEMKHRILNELSHWVVLPESELLEKLQVLTQQAVTPELLSRARTLCIEILDTSEGLKIQTIHSFCQSLLRKFPLESGVSPYFTVIDEQTEQELIEEAKQQLVSGVYRQENAELQEAIEAVIWQFQEDGFRAFLSKIVHDRDKCLALFDSGMSEDEIISALYVTIGVPETTKEAVEASFCSDEKTNSQGLKHAATILQEGSDGYYDRGVGLANWLSASVEKRLQSLEDYISLFLTQKLEPRKKLMTKALSDKDPSVLEVLVTEQERVMEMVEIRKGLHMAKQSQAFLCIARSLLFFYAELKKRHAYLDYDDLISLSLALLHEKDIAPWVLYKLDGGIDHLLVDEAQDTSPQQWRIIDALCQEFFAGEGSDTSDKTLFVVGDEKQSIFSFQGADPQTFVHRHDYFSNHAKAARKGWHSLSLDTSFRSTSPILELVDAVFQEPEMKKHITFSPENIAHQVHRLEYHGKVELWPVVKNTDAPERTAWSIPKERKLASNPKQLLAEKIADQIKTWLVDAPRKILFSKERYLEPGDILVLVRKRDDFVGALIRALKQRNIPVAGMDRMLLTEHLAIQDVMALGYFLLLPEDDLTLATVLKSPFVGLSEEALFELAYDRGQESLWKRLRECHKDIYDELTHLLAKVDKVPPSALFHDILEVQDGRKKLVSRLGTEVNDLLDEFLSLTYSYEQLHTPTLQGFLHWLETSNTVIKRDFDQQSNEIRIMTVHASKGLQAPIVFLPDTTQLPVPRHSILWSDTEPSFPLWPGKSTYSNALFTSLKERMKKHEYAEYLRLLYVALTRAGDELYVCGWQGSRDVPEDSWYGHVKRTMQGIAKEVTDNAEKMYVLENHHPQVLEVPAVSQQESDAALPAFLFQPAPVEEEMTAIAPSQSDEMNVSPLDIKASYVVKGQLVHRLLEVLPTVVAENQHEVAQRIVKDVEEGAAIIKQVLAILSHPTFQPLFGPNSKAEVPLMGKVGESIVRGQVDRLVVTDDEVLIVDYKTNREPPKDIMNVPDAYQKQMALYAQLLEQIYPEKKIRKLLLWTETAMLMELDK